MGLNGEHGGVCFVPPHAPLYLHIRLHICNMCVRVCVYVSGHGCGLYFQGPPAPPHWWLTAAISFLSEWVYNPCSDHTLCLHLVGVSRTRAESRHNSSVPAVYLISLYYNNRLSGCCSPPDRFYYTISEKYDSGYSWHHNLFFSALNFHATRRLLEIC